MFAYKVCIASIMEKLYINDKFLRTGIMCLLLYNNKSWGFQAAHHGKQAAQPFKLLLWLFLKKNSLPVQHGGITRVSVK